MKNNKILLALLRIIPVVLCVVFGLVWFLNRDEISVESIISHAPENYALAIVFIMLLYAVKSLSIMFPLIVLKLAVGLLFPTFAAIPVNIAGITVSLIISYLIGRISGSNMLDKLKSKYPKLNEIEQGRSSNRFAEVFFLRSVYILPLDVVSLYLGSTKMNFSKYLAASLLGVIPSTIIATVLGTAITEPASPEFWISALLLIGYSVLSGYLYKRQEKHI